MYLVVRHHLREQKKSVALDCATVPLPISEQWSSLAEWTMVPSRSGAFFGNGDRMQRVRLIHWDVVEADEKAAELRVAGYRVDCEPLTPAVLRALKCDPPAAVVIDLSRLPGQGRDVGLAIRHAKTTRGVPLVFVGGDSNKVGQISQQLPDAEYTGWSRIRSALKRAIANPPKDPVVPESALAGYAGTPLPKKLGIKENSVVALIDTPQGFERQIGALPPGVTFRRTARGRPDLIIWFAKSSKHLSKRMAWMAELTGQGGIWIAWPKEASGMTTDLTQAVVRKLGLAAGLVDYKICAIDSTWSGLKFARRKQG